MITSGTIKKKVYDSWGSKAYLIIDWEIISLSFDDNTTTIKYTPKLETQNFFGTYNVEYSYKFGDSETFFGTQAVNFDSGLATFPFVEITSKYNSNGEFNKLCQLHVEWSSIQKFSFDLSEYLTIEDIPIKATLTRVDNFNDEEDFTIYYNNPSRNIITVSLYTASGSRITSSIKVPTTAGMATISISDADRIKIRQLMTRDTSMKVKVNLESRIFNPVTSTTEFYFSSLYTTISLINHEPILNPIVKDTNNVTTALTGDNSKFIKYFSNLYFDTGAVAKKEATIDNQYIVCGSQSKEDYTSLTGTFENIDSNTVYFDVTDSRGMIARDVVVLDLVPYFKPTISLSVLPFSLAGDLTFTLKGKYFNSSFGVKDNSFSVSYAIVESGQNLSTATYQDVPHSASTIVGNDYSTNYTISGLDPNKSYQLMVKIQDSLDSSYTSRQSIAASPLFDWSRTDFKFNVPVYLKDTTIPLEGLNDYVTRQGTSGDWFYRLWYSGKVELFGMKDISYEACKTDFGGWYRTAEQSSPTYPFTINNAIVTANYESDGYGAIIWPITRSTTSKPFDFYLIRPTEALGIVGKVTFHVIGDLEGVIA